MTNKDQITHTIEGLALKIHTSVRDTVLYRIKKEVYKAIQEDIEREFKLIMDDLEVIVDPETFDIRINNRYG